MIAVIRWSDGQRIALLADEIDHGLAIGQVPMGSWQGIALASPWAVFDLDTQWPIAIGETRDATLFAAGARLAVLAGDRGYSIPDLLADARARRDHKTWSPA